MKDQPSLTAWRVALSRAAHQVLDRPPVLDDPIALAIVGERGVAQIRVAALRYNLPPARYLRAFLVARSRVAEEALADSVRRGVRQYVVLGAGLDTFAHRNPFPAAELRVFEVDHPATQAWKRRQLAAASLAPPESLTFVPVDFESQALPERLESAGFRAGEPAFFSWLGVTMYLERATVLGTLAFVARLPEGSGVVFDYAVPPATLGPVRRMLQRALMRRVAVAGEPWKSFFDPRELADELRALGFRQLEDLGPEALNARYFGERADALRVGGLGRVMSARS
ncbi:MAG TPA: class I SAM-dependent methyltransferase [Steroidobacteraceae bacterium]|nr:class I SAM-dependent methyltransferase [Steroidobacteraceae bacterium]